MAPPALIVHHLEHMQAAVRTAAASGRGLTVITPPQAGRFAGPAYHLELLRQAIAGRTDVEIRAILDCGDDAALALFALAMGWPAVVLSGRQPARSRVADIARQHGAQVLARRPRAIDLATTPDLDAACRKAL